MALNMAVWLLPGVSACFPRQSYKEAAMQTGNTTPKIPMKSAAEYDVLTRARKWYGYTSRPGVCKRIKRAYNKRVRRLLKRIW